MTKRALFFLCGLALLTMAAPSAYVHITRGNWPSGATVPMYLQLGPAPRALIDGAGSWDDVAASAVALWSRHLTAITFVSRVETRVPVSGDGINNVFFAGDVYGNAFGPDVLSTTTSWSRGNNRSEVDVIFNRAKAWDSYRGPQRSGSVDFRRVALHSFGHALGLTHPDLNGQSVAAIMNSDSHIAGSPHDDLQTDDIEGVRALYGGPPLPAIPPPAVIPRAERIDFRHTVENYFRANGARLTPTFVDIDSVAIWMVEYAWYRASYCDHATAAARVFAQVEGRGIQPVCAEPASREVMPSQEDLLAFRGLLETEFRDVLRSPARESYRDHAEDATSMTLYLLYRWAQGLSHAEAVAAWLAIFPPAPAPAPAPVPAPSPGTSGYSAAISAISCRHVRTDSRAEYFTITASGTAAAADVGGRVQFHFGFLGVDGLMTYMPLEAQLSCGSWSPEVNNGAFDEYALCRRTAGQPATTAWSATFSNYSRTTRGRHTAELAATPWDLNGSRSTQRAPVTCTSP